MLLSGALFALFMMGFWLYCLTDAILTPASECRGLPKPAWIAVIALTFIGGAIAWLIAREPLRTTSGIAATRRPRWDPDAPGDLDDPETGYFRSRAMDRRGRRRSPPSGRPGPGGRGRPGRAQGPGRRPGVPPRAGPRDPR